MKKKGFTLIELLVVIAIIGLLSTLAVISLSNARTKAAAAKIASNARSFQTALEMCASDSDTGTYPVASSGASPSTLSGSSCGSRTLLSYMPNLNVTSEWESIIYIATTSASYTIRYGLADATSTLYGGTM